MLKEVVEEVLLENGILAESTQKSNEVFSFKVGSIYLKVKWPRLKKYLNFIYSKKESPSSAKLGVFLLKKRINLLGNYGIMIKRKLT